MGIYGVINNAAGGHVVTTILIALIAMFFTAISYGKMARVYPSAGSAYTYVGQEIHPGLGYLTGWAMVMDYILNPLICTIICSKLTQNILPEIPYWTLAIFYAVFFSVLNLGGVKTSARINEVLAAGMTVVVVIFLPSSSASFWVITSAAPAFSPSLFIIPPHSISAPSAAAPRSLFSPTSASTVSPPFPKKWKIRAATSCLPLYWSALLPAFSPPPKFMPRNSSGAPNRFPRTKSNPPSRSSHSRSAAFFYSTCLNFTVLIANIGSGIASQLAAARLLYGMGRNDAIPKSFFGKIEEKRRIPANNVMVIGAVALIGAFLITYERGAEMLNFGAFIAFMGVNAAAFVHYYLRASEKKLGNLLMPLIGFVVCGVIWWSLSPPAKIAGTIWLALGVAYGVWKTSGFRKEMSFEIPPEE